MLDLRLTRFKPIFSRQMSVPVITTTSTSAAATTTQQHQEQQHQRSGQSDVVSD